MPYSAAKRRPTHLRRTWLFCPGAAAAAQGAALEAAPDVLVPDLEDFTPPAPGRAREMILGLLRSAARRAWSVRCA
jgi:citrate lyase subunit beta/citryl-CoA lyase